MKKFLVAALGLMVMGSAFSEEVHLVKTGDTLSEIAGKYGLSSAALLEYNSGITNASLIFVGQKIRIPVEAVQKNTASHVPPESDTNDTPDVEAYIRAQLGALPVQSVKPAPIPGMYEVIVGGQIAYFSADMKYLIEGDIVDYQKRVNLTDQVRNKLSAAAFDGMQENDYLAFTPKSGTKHVINVFTDVDCGFCRKLHQEVPALNEKGVEVRYFLYPRAGLASNSAKKLENIWCAKNRQDAMTRVKSGQSVDSKTCENPIKDHIALGQQMGLTGTPLIITGNGSRINGYRPADQLYAQLLSEAVDETTKEAEK
jgi:thiol:disulfide interchange protein DsbC